MLIIRQPHGEQHSRSQLQETLMELLGHKIKPEAEKRETESVFLKQMEGHKGRRDPDPDTLKPESGIWECWDNFPTETTERMDYSR